MTRSTLLCTLALLVACREPAGEPQTSASQTPSASAPVFERSAAAPEVAEALAKAKSDPEPEAAPEEAGEPEAAAGAGGGAPAEPEVVEAIPEVDVRNVGMHIGGEKNTAEQKRPIRAVVKEHYDAMKRCWGKASDPPHKATFGVDMRIPGEGGKIVVQKPRSGLEGEAKQCLVDVFAAIEFPRQPGGRPRMVSFSVEFSKKK